MDLPPAPTPPSSGGMPSASDRTQNLLSLLKFSGNNAHQQKIQQQQREAQQAQDQPQSRPQENQPTSPQQQQSQQSTQQQPQYEYSQEASRQHQPQTASEEDNDYGYHQQASLPQHQYPTHIHQPAPTSADPTGLLAALMRGAHESEDSPRPSHVQPHPQEGNTFAGGSPSGETRSFLLELLNRPKPSQTEQPLMKENVRANEANSQSAKQQEHARSYGHEDAYAAAQKYQQQQHSFAQLQHGQGHGSSLSFPPPQEPSEDTNALYQKLLGNLSHGSSQQYNNQHSHAHATQASIKDHSSPAGSQQYDYNNTGYHHSPAISPPVARRATDRPIDRSESHHSHHSQHSHPSQRSTKLTTPSHPPGSESKDHETVAEAVDDLAQTASDDASRAVARAEQEQAHHADQDILTTARIVEKQVDDIEDSLAPPPYDPVEHSLIRDIRDSCQSIVDDAQGVADSWESADQEEIVVIEEKEAPPVRVYNFPMKPWISLQLQDDIADSRPEFRDESIMDIARLKKDFDQMDRNLYTATQTYMTYGMSKQGGLRVIRQDDGKDAKVFTDTKDRVFNLAMSLTPSEHDGIHKEAIIGTGVSGTVYWVQIKDGDKDHIDDAHLEQYGFALPPLTAQDGDAPGGVLKTRARASTAHPEFFAVGRGKSISIIWPAYIMQRNLFKQGHDRVVDTEALQKQCSLKINTGKAGKDFTFSQDDTVVVSLDKSGRVKFWDVRDLTAAKDGSDPRAPLPAETSLEVKEPLMTLSSTPEGEKAWPTSVLLLDKQRPYQKRCALRYMIVGMKQNHTLQLWDLALGKPVQEFNLPHSKESDAVCSVMYHPASGMIVIGHPTRNSIYFAHLSAPKYNLKSVSQAEYIQRLVAQDASIPQPDSTAVISGVREYSFASRGVLRSLDILSSPAMAQESDEPTLFELYAMHSKGVACLLIKQAELGWNRDNKVLDGVDAVTEGIVTVSKLKTPQPPEASEARIAPPPRVEKTVQPVQVESRALETTPVKVKNETKEEIAAQSSKESQPEKPERKSRKKKTTANQADSTNVSAKGKDAKEPITGIPNVSFEAAITTVETRLGASLTEVLNTSLSNMQDHVDAAARARDETYQENQLQLLDMVSEVLNENTQKVLEHLVHTQFTETVIPAISGQASRAVTDVVEQKLQPHITSLIQKEVQKSLPQSLTWALKTKDVTNSIADRVSSSISSTLQQDILGGLTQRLTPTITNTVNTAVAQTTQRVVGELHQSYQQQFDQLKAQHVTDSQKIDQLASLVTRLTDMVGTMTQTQSTMQAEFLRNRSQPPVHDLPGVGQGSTQESAPQGYGHLTQSYRPEGQVESHSGNYNTLQAPTHAGPYLGSPQYNRNHQNAASPRGSQLGSEQASATGHLPTLAANYQQHMQTSDAEAEQDLNHRIRVIEELIGQNKVQDALIKWIQSGREEDIFRRCLSRYPPQKFRDLPLILLLVVIATISKDIKPSRHLKEEVEWIDMAVNAFGQSMITYDYDINNDYHEVMKSTQQTLQLLHNRLKPLIESMQGDFPTDPFLTNVDRNKMDRIMKQSMLILDSFQGGGQYN